MINVDFNLVIKKMSKKYGISENKIEHVVFSIGRFINFTMREGKWDGFYMRGFGKFVVKEGRLRAIRSKLNRMMDSDDSLNLVKGKDV